METCASKPENAFGGVPGASEQSGEQKRIRNDTSIGISRFHFDWIAAVAATQGKKPKQVLAELIQEAINKDENGGED